MKYNIGDLIGEFRQSDEADEEYTTKLKGLYIIKGLLPQNGDWEAICLSDCGFTNSIPVHELEQNNGKYITGGREIIMHAAGMDDGDLPWFDMRKARENDGEE